MADARLELDGTEPSGVTLQRGTPPVRRTFARWLWPSLAGTALVVAATALLKPEPRPAPAAGHFTIELPDPAPVVTLDVPGTNEGPVAVAPDGQQLVYVAADGRSTRLYARAMADLTPRALPGTEGARLPFFSPDGKWVGIFADGKLKKSPIAGGTPAILADAPTGCGASWSPSGQIAFAPVTAAGLLNGGIAELGVNLRNDHPIGIQYCGGGYNTGSATGSCGDADFVAPLSQVIGGTRVFWVETGGNTTRNKTDMVLYNRAFGGANPEPSVECASCHDPHVENTGSNPTFLRISNSASAVCLSCHVK